MHDVACEFCERSKDGQKQLARTSLSLATSAPNFPVYTTIFSCKYVKVFVKLTVSTQRLFLNDNRHFSQ